MKFGSLLLLCFTHLVCLAQTPSESRTIYTRKDGLSENTISAIVKDVRGFLWIGTGEGLNRFDGTHFTSWLSDPNSIATLSGNNIYDILQYQPGQLLIATNNGLSLLNTFTGRFENEKITIPALKKGSGIYIRSLFKDNSGKIYINHSGEIDVFTNDLRFLYRLTDTDWGRPLKGIIISYEQWQQDSKGRIWLPSDNLGICIVDEKVQQVYYYNNNPLHYSFLQKAPVRSFYYDEKSQQVFTSFLGAGLRKFDLSTGRSQIQYFNTAHEGEARTINAITRKNDRLICCGGQHIYSLDPVTMQYYTLFDDPGAPPASFFNCSTVLNDVENIWIGTETKGLVQVSYRNSFLQQIPLPDTHPGYSDFCSGILRSVKDGLYFAYGEGGLLEVNEQTGKAQRYVLKDAGNRPLLIHRICKDSGDNILVGTPTGFFSFNTATKTTKRTARLPSFTDNLNVNYILRDARSDIWASFSNPNALGHYNSRTGEFKYYPGYLIGGKKIFDPGYTITRMAEDKKGKIWMVSFQTSGTIGCYDPSSGEWKSYPVTDKARALFAGKELNSIFIAGNIIWTGNIYGLGLVRYDYTNDSLQQLSRKDGLLSDNILAITKDKNSDNLFLCTMAGIDYYNPGTHEIRSLMADDGTIDWGFAFVQYYDTINNQLIYGLNDRIIIVKSNLWEAPPGDSLLSYIDDIRVNNSIFHADSGTIHLTHLQKNISIHFTSINYNRSAAPFYAFKMNGVDKDWNISREVTTTNYSNLSPGEYTFMVKAKGQSGIWGPVNDTLKIVIRPAIWQTTWFWIISGLSVVLVLSWLIGRRISHIRKSAELKQKLAETEMMALRAQMNPHFIFNCLNAIDNLMQTNQADKATAWLNSFARLIRSVLENSKNNMVPFHKDLETLQLYIHLEQFRTSNKFMYELQVDPELINGDYKVPPLIVQPFVENAIQHGLLNRQAGERKLSVHARLHDGFIQYIIRDNGVGRARAGEIKSLNRPEHRSYGIQITTERLQLHNQKGKGDDIVITDLSENGLASGTQIEVRVKTD
jgi:ligand-binding sensor domain-containing protein/two-component sensor histidine kinase